MHVLYFGTWSENFLQSQHITDEAHGLNTEVKQPGIGPSA